MKSFVTGVNGQLGYDVVCEASKRGYDVVASDITGAYAGVTTPPSPFAYVQLDITERAAVEKIITPTKPDIVVHCAAWTDVDGAEAPENRERVYAINVKGTEYIASACKLVNATLFYISTDYVFDGQGAAPWQADCTSYQPLNVYGQTKLDGEKAVTTQLTKFFVVRIAWVFGVNGKNFVKAILNAAQKHDTLRVVNDQIGTPTYTCDLARLLLDMSETDKYGFYHVTNEGSYISWFDFACEIVRQAGYATKVVPVSTAEYGLSKAKRPFNSRLDRSKIIANGFAPLPIWQDALSRYLRVIGG